MRSRPPSLPRAPLSPAASRAPPSRRPRHPRRDGVDANARRPLARERLRELNHRGFAHRVRGAAAGALHARRGRDVHDRRSPARRVSQRRVQRPAELVRRAEVQIHDAIVLLVGRVQRRLPHVRPRVVDQDVDPVRPQRGDLVHQLGSPRGRGDVPRERVRGAGDELAVHDVEDGLDVSPDDQDGSAQGDELARGREADALRAAGDDGAVAVQPPWARRLGLDLGVGHDGRTEDEARDVN
eukprot:31555-Pelagococcus_subviridis.AAC.18